MTAATATDPRSAKALAILTAAATWQQGRTKDGRDFFAVPSQCTDVLHMTDARECSCRDFQYRRVACKHIRAVAAYLALTAAPTAPAPTSERSCTRGGQRVRPESIYPTCDDCSYIGGGF